MVGSNQITTGGYCGGMNVLELSVGHPSNPTYGLGGNPPPGDPLLGEPPGGFPPSCGCKLALLGYWNETSLPWIGGPLATCTFRNKVASTIY